MSLLLCFAIPSASLSQPGKEGAKPTYESLLEKVKKQDPAADFTALRMAYFDSPKHKWTDSDLRNAMFKALGEKDYDKAIGTAGKILNDNYLDIDAHLISAIVSKRKNDSERQKMHDFVGRGLVQSILASGDGKTPETAYVVISVDEEYSLLRIQGLRTEEQSLVPLNGHHYDVMKVVSSDGGQSTVYFNIDRPHAEEMKMFQ
jgi:hypothetical protein